MHFFIPFLALVISALWKDLQAGHSWLLEASDCNASLDADSRELHLSVALFRAKVFRCLFMALDTLESVSEVTHHTNLCFPCLGVFLICPGRNILFEGRVCHSFFDDSYQVEENTSVLLSPIP
jgi:hypothetical protein